MYQYTLTASLNSGPEAWGEPQNRSVADYLFSVGNTPFGPLAGAYTRSFLSST
jgi:hypothetical protein